MPRPSTLAERAVLVELSRGGPLELARQLDSAEYGEARFPGSQSFSIVVPDSAPNLPLPDGIIPTADRAVTRYDRDIGGVMLWLKGGRVTACEYHWVTGTMPDRPPEPEEIAKRYLP